MATFNFEAPMPTVGLPADCALRMRVNKSAIGSVMLIVRASPARLGQARYLAAAGGFAQLCAGQAELAVHAARATGDGAAEALPALRCVARLLLQFRLCSCAFF